MRICPICHVEYDDDIDFCFKDGSPLDDVEPEGDASSEEQGAEAGPSDAAENSVEMLPPDATGLPDDSLPAPPPEGGGDGEQEAAPGITVVPGGLTSPLDDEEDSMDGGVDPFDLSIRSTAPAEAEVPLTLEPAHELDEPSESAPDTQEMAPSDVVTPGSLDEGGIEVSDKLAVVEEGEAREDEPGEPEDGTAEAADQEAPEEALDDAQEGAADDEAADEDEEDAQGDAADDEAADGDEEDAFAAVPPAREAGSGPSTFDDPVYASIPVGEKKGGKGLIIGVVALIVVIILCVVGYVVLRGGGSDDEGGGPQLVVDDSPEDRAPVPGGAVDAGGDAAADAGGAENPDDAEPTPADDGSEEQPAEDEEVETPTPDDGADRVDDAAGDASADETPTPGEPDAGGEEEPATPDDDGTADTGTTTNPWEVGSGSTDTPTSGDPSNPWASGGQSQSGKVTVSSNPLGASFSIDGQHRGTTPLTIDVPYGSHAVRVEMADYVSQERTVSVQSGAVFVDFTLQKAVTEVTGKLTVFTNPEPGASLFVDGVFKGTTPITVDVTRGSHTLRVELDGFSPKSETIDLSDLQSGETRRRVIALQ